MWPAVPTIMFLMAPLSTYYRWLYLGPLTALYLGSLVYCALAIIGAWRYKRSGAPKLTGFPPVTVLRPLAGAADNTEANLRSLFAQTYPDFEVLLSVHEPSDPAAPIARRVMAEFPRIPSRLVVAGVSPLPNAKVWSLRAMLPLARHEHLFMSDSDVSHTPDSLATVMAELAQPGVALITCPYRAAGGPRLWSRVESLGLNTDFLAGMLTQRLLNGMDFAVGPTIATRKTELEAIGGLEMLQRYLAEDFVMGNAMHARGRTVILSRSIIEHHIGNDRLISNWKHRLRWARSTRRSRPMGYIGEIFTKPVAIATILWILAPGAWGLLLVALMFRAGVAWATAVEILHDPLIARYWWLLPVEDYASFVTWALGFFGNKIIWRGRELTLLPDGSFRM